MDKTLQLLGVAMRAGKLISGESLCLKEIRTRRAYVVVLSTDASSNVDKKITDKCTTFQIPLIRYGQRHELGRAIGKSERVVLAIIDQGLAQSLIHQFF